MRAGRRLRPRVRAADELERSGIGLRLVERDPARDHLRRNEIVRVRGVLVEADRLRARRLPEHVVLEDAHPAVAHELRRESARSLREHLRRDDVVGLPRVAELACSVLGIAAGDPVHLVRPDPGLVLARRRGAGSARGAARARTPTRALPPRSGSRLASEGLQPARACRTRSGLALDPARRFFSGS